MYPDGCGPNHRCLPLHSHVQFLLGGAQCWSSGSETERWVTFGVCGLPSGSTALVSVPTQQHYSHSITNETEPVRGRKMLSFISLPLSFFCTCFSLCVLHRVFLCVCLCVLQSLILATKSDKITMKTNRGKLADNQKKCVFV